MDGTLANSEKYYIDGTKACFKQEGKDVSIDDIKDNIVGVTMDATYKYASKILDVDYYNAKIIYDDYFKQHPLNYKDYLYEDSLNVLKTLKQKGYKLALCTMNEKENVDSFLSNGFEKIFDCILSYNDKIREKPYPDIYLKALEKLKLNPNEAIVVEDSLSGIRAGKNAGIYVIATNEAKLNFDLSEADKIIENIKELLDYE